MTIKIELIYDSDCPNVELARTHLSEALQIVDLEEHWKEWDRMDPAAPVYVSKYGSPTVLIDGCDVVDNKENSGAACCRVYEDNNGGFLGAPPTKVIKQALRASYSEKLNHSKGKRTKTKVIRSVAALPGISAAFLPGLTCPACWPAYAGLLGSLGVGFINYTPYLLPITVGLLVLALFALGIDAKNRHGFGPLLVGSSASVAIILGKFFLENNLVMYFGISLLILASVWNAFPSRATSSCPPWYYA